MTEQAGAEGAFAFEVAASPSQLGRALQMPLHVGESFEPPIRAGQQELQLGISRPHPTDAVQPRQRPLMLPCLQTNMRAPKREVHTQAARKEANQQQSDRHTDSPPQPLRRTDCCRRA